MHRLTSTLFLAVAGGTLAAAQSSSDEVVTIFLLQADQQPLVASVVNSDAKATTLAIQCAPGTDSADCGFHDGASVTVGPSTFHATYTGPEGSLTVIPDCKLFGSPSATSAECEQTFVGPQGFITAPGADSPATTGDATIITSSTASGGTFGPTDIGSFMVAVTITAGKVEETGGSESGSTVGTTAMETGSSISGTTSSGAAASATESEGAAFVGLESVGIAGAVAGLSGILLALL